MQHAAQLNLTDPLETAIAAAEGGHPRAAALTRELLTQAGSIFKQQLRFLLEQRPHFWPHAERLTRAVQQLGNDPAQCLIEYTVTTIKEQVRFLQSGKYGHDDFDAVLAQVYANPEVMKGFYLDGLLLSYAYWPSQLDLYHFFESEFLRRLPTSGLGAEVGFGHGLYLLDVLTARPELRAQGYDISEHSMSYAARLLGQEGIAAERFQLALADVRQGFPVPDHSYDWFVFAEILEHIPDPEGALREVRRIVKPGAPIFLTTVMNSNAMDHLYLYTELGQIKAQVAAAGMAIEAEQVLQVADYTRDSRDPSSTVALIVRPRG
jgi:SAM-dependent methyltransferase